MSYPYPVQPLPYGYNALAPCISENTLHFHHDKHYQTYVDNLNKLMESCDYCKGKTLEDLLTDPEQVPEDKRQSLVNNGGGVYNHQFYFDSLGGDGSRPTGKLAQAMDKAFGSFEGWWEKFKAAALAQFGSGYAWLVCKGDTLAIEATPNQNNPMSVGLCPLLCVDVWEHAYYLDYQNRRAEYLDAWLQAVNWRAVEARYGAI